MVFTTGFIAEILQVAKTKTITEFTHFGVGTGNSTPAISDTDLTTPVLRKAIQTYQELTSSVIISGYFNSTEANGSTLVEAGCFDAISSGNLKSRFLINSLVKTSSKELWIDEEVKFTITQESE